MYNEIKHLHNGLTVLFCKDTKAKNNVEVYVDTEIYHYLSSLKVEWKSWSTTRGNRDGSIEKFIGGTNEVTGKVINLKKVIGDYFFGKGKHFTLLNGNHCDLRQRNIFPFKPGTLTSQTMQRKVAELRKQLSPIKAGNKEEDTVATPNNNNVQIIEYGQKILILENEKVVSELSKIYLDAILNKYQTQLTLV